MNFYLNFVPIQELSDWFEHWADEGRQAGLPVRVRRAVHLGLDDVPRLVQGPTGMGQRQVPWEFCLAEWNAQFLGDRAFRIGEAEKKDLRWEAGQFRAGKLWHRWDYPYPVGSSGFDDQQTVLAHYITRQLARLPHLGSLRQFPVGISSRSGSCATAWTGDARS